MSNKYFTDKELACKCCGVNLMEQKFVDLLTQFRIRWGRPLVINSAYRCAKHNQEVGGTNMSQHLKGNAVDIKVIAPDRFYFVKLAYELGFTGIGIDKEFIHLDKRESAPSLWKY